MLEDFDRLHRYSARLDRVEGKDADSIAGRPTADDLREHYDRTKAAISKLNALTIYSGEYQMRDFYMNIGPMYADPVARQLYAEIASIEEQHVTQYESIIDPTETWLEKWLMLNQEVDLTTPAQAQPVGTVPPPTSVKGVATSAMEMIKGRKPTVLIDKLGERLAFERTGVRLHQAVLVKFDALGSWEQLMQIGNEELEHFELLKQCIEQVGADPTAMTPSADIIAVTAAGVLGVITDPRTTLAQALQAVLVAERADLEGWQLLIQLADELGHDDMARRFREAEQVEERYGAWVRAWLAKAVLQDARRENEPR